MASFSTVQIKGTTSNSSTSACGIYWEELSTDIASNTSVVKAYLCIKNKFSSDSIRDSGCSFSITVNGIKKSSGTKAVTIPPNSDWYVVFESDAVTVEHDADGKKTITISARGTFPYTSPGNVTASGEAVLTEFVRGSTISSFAGAVLEVNGSNAIELGIARGSSDFNHTVVYKLGALTETHYGVADSDRFVVPISWRTSGPLRTSTSAVGSVVLTTFKGDVPIGEPVSSTFTALVPENVKPSLTGENVQLELVQQSGFNASVYVENRSKVKAIFADTSEVPVVSHIVQLDGVTYSSEGNVITTREILGTNVDGADVALKFRVVDSRGRYSGWAEKTIRVYKYATPSVINANVYRCNADMSPDESGAYICITAGYKISSLGGTNTVAQFAPRYRSAAGEMGSWMTGLAANTPYRIGGTLSPTQTYVVEITVKDSTGNSHTLSFTVPTVSVTFNLKPGGKGAAFGKFAERDELLDSAWPIKAPAIELNEPLPLASGGLGVTTVSEIIKLLNVLTLSGGTLSGDVEIVKTDGETKFVVTNKNGSLALSINTSRGIYDITNQKWVLMSHSGSADWTFYGKAEALSKTLTIPEGGTNATTASGALTSFGIRRGRTISMDVAANAVSTQTVTFSAALSATPLVVLTIEGTHSNTAFGRITYEVASVTASGFTVRVINPTDSTFNVVFNYIAIIP